jgi:Protein of unknown function (DUF2934)
MKASRRGGAMSSGGRVTTSPVTSSPTLVAPSHDAISRRAFLKWQARGCPSGTALQDWLEAEAELKAELRPRRRY